MSPNEALNELKKDLEELEKILTNVTRSNVRHIIANEISKLQASIQTLQLQQQQQTPVEKQQVAEAKPSLYTTKITNYGFDETSKFVKLYVSIKDLDKLSPDQIKCDFTESSFKLIVHNHLEKNHMLQVLKLAHKIKPNESTCRVKTGNIVVSLKKENESETWGNITEAERKEKEAKDAKYDAKGDDMTDPSAGIMNLMKKMYDEGDDDMKRMIKKTWYETQQKTGSGGMPGV